MLFEKDDPLRGEMVSVIGPGGKPGTEAAPPIAQKALAYGFPGIMVDGNDVLAVIAAVKGPSGAPAPDRVRPRA